MALVKVGCCGFPVARAKYFASFKIVEVQQTFYKLPSIETLRSWRSEAPQDFEFTMKAWQVITHPPTSPTWRKAGIKVPEDAKGRYGFLRLTRENLEAWSAVVECARVLRAKVIVVQTPPSFRCTDENIRSARRFFEEVSGSDYLIAWEPRGDWLANPKSIVTVIRGLNVIHVVDPLLAAPVEVGEVVYFRLHGRHEGGRIVYRHRYSDDELHKVISKVLELADVGARTVYVMFNNVYMYGDALRFKELAAKKGLEVL